MNLKQFFKWAKKIDRGSKCTRYYHLGKCWVILVPQSEVANVPLVFSYMISPILWEQVIACGNISPCFSSFFGKKEGSVLSLGVNYRWLWNTWRRHLCSVLVFTSLYVSKIEADSFMEPLLSSCYRNIVVVLLYRGSAPNFVAPVTRYKSTSKSSKQNCLAPKSQIWC